jgi:hypothetical protein
MEVPCYPLDGSLTGVSLASPVPHPADAVKTAHALSGQDGGAGPFKPSQAGQARMSGGLCPLPSTPGPPPPGHHAPGGKKGAPHALSAGRATGTGRWRLRQRPSSMNRSRHRPVSPAGLIIIPARNGVGMKAFGEEAHRESLPQLRGGGFRALFSAVVSASSSPLPQARRLERLRQIHDQIVGMLDADAEADGAFADAEAGAQVCRHAGMGGGSRVARQ